MKKTFSVVLALCLAALLLCACAGNKLPDGMEESTLEAQAKAFIDAANAKDYDQLVTLFSPDYPLSADDWETALTPVWEKSGAFTEYGKTAFATANDNNLGEMGVAIVETKYENQTINWQVAFDSQGNIVTFVH